MESALDCFPCFLRQCLEASRLVTADVAVQRRLLGEVMRHAAALDPRRPPVAVGQAMHRRLREVCGDPDPYRDVKAHHRRLVAEALPRLDRQVRESADPLGVAVRLAIAANAIDLGVPGALTRGTVRRALDDALTEPFHGDVAEFADAAATARDVLYLADNVGELTVDRLLVDLLAERVEGTRGGRVTVAVRGGAVLNDATRADAADAGITGRVRVVDNGSDAPGTLLDDCSEEFRDRFRAADLVIAKGQGNFETLDDVAAPVFFLFKVKCDVVAGHVGLPLGTHVLLRSRSWAPGGGPASPP